MGSTPAGSNGRPGRGRATACPNSRQRRRHHLPAQRWPPATAATRSPPLAAHCYRRGRQTLIRTDSAGGTHDFMSWLARRGRWLSYSVGMVITEAIHEHVLKIPVSAWTPVVETDGGARDGALVAELTGDVLDGWPMGTRLIARKERPHPGAQLRLRDGDGMRLTCFATNTSGRPIAELELRHRLRARAEDRIRAARATGLRNLPLHTTAQNKVWLEIALDLLAWMPMLALTGKARLREPRRLRFRLFSAAAQLVTTGRRRILRLSAHWPWTSERDHRRPRTAHAPARPRLTSNLNRPDDSTTRPRAVEPGAHPTRQPGHRPAHHQLRQAKGPTDSVDGPSRKIEAKAADPISPAKQPRQFIDVRCVVWLFVGNAAEYSPELLTLGFVHRVQVRGDVLKPLRSNIAINLIGR
ncbi:DDE family transposase [Streptomyces sp. Ag109_O5-1]|nr:DDE family transposase [Streptomyces sp. Ag109_O5-1]